MAEGPLLMNALSFSLHSQSGHLFMDVLIFKVFSLCVREAIVLKCLYKMTFYLSLHYLLYGKVYVGTTKRPITYHSSMAER